MHPTAATVNGREAKAAARQAWGMATLIVTREAAEPWTANGAGVAGAALETAAAEVAFRFHVADHGSDEGKLLAHHVVAPS
jgi:hypothetical protein